MGMSKINHGWIMHMNRRDLMFKFVNSLHVGLTLKTNCVLSTIDNHQNGNGSHLFNIWSSAQHWFSSLLQLMLLSNKLAERPSSMPWGRQRYPRMPHITCFLTTHYTLTTPQYLELQQSFSLTVCHGLNFLHYTLALYNDCQDANGWHKNQPTHSAWSAVRPSVLDTVKPNNNKIIIICYWSIEM